MSAPVKAVLAGAAVVGAGGTGIWLISSAGMPEWTSLSADSNFSSETGYRSKYGEKYARLLVGVKTTDTENPDNTAWWEWSFKNNYRSTDGFGSGIDSGEKLKKECEKVYKGTLSNTKINVGSDEYEEAKVWKLCSPAGKKPQSIEDVKSGPDKDNVTGLWKDKIGANDTHKSYLLAISAPENKQIWEQLDLQFKKENPSSDFFKISETEPTIKDLCSKAYKETTTGTESN